MNKLATRLEQLERDIELGIRSIGKALLEIHDTKAYLDHYDTFETYCKERWGFTDRHARDLINAETVREKIGRTLPVETLKTQHLLEISKVPPAKQTQVAASVIAEAEAENRTPTTKDFKIAAKEFIKPKPEPKPEPIQDVWEDVPDAEPVPETEPSPQALSAPIQAVATQLTGMLKELKRLADHVGGEWLDLTDLETQINALKYSIRQSIYWMDCMDCEGKGCKTCHKHGWLSLDRKKHLTQEQKDKVGS